MVIYVCLEGKVNIFVIEGWEEKVLFAIHGLKAWFEIYGFRSEPPIYGASSGGTMGRKVPPKVPPKPSVSGVLFPGGGSNNGGDVIDILNLPKSDTKEDTAAVRNITHV